MQKFKCMTYDKKISLFIFTSRVKKNFKNPPKRRENKKKPLARKKEGGGGKCRDLQWRE